MSCEIECQIETKKFAIECLKKEIKDLKKKKEEDPKNGDVFIDREGDRRIILEVLRGKWSVFSRNMELTPPNGESTEHLLDRMKRHKYRKIGNAFTSVFVF